MSKDKTTLDRILDESAAKIRAEIVRVETEKKHVTACLDEWIAKLRSVLPVGETLPLLDVPQTMPMTRAPAHAPVNGARPRGEIQVKIYEHLMAHPEAGYREIVEAVYGEYNEPHYNSTRNAIAALKKNGRVCTSQHQEIRPRDAVLVSERHFFDGFGGGVLGSLAGAPNGGRPS